MKAKTGIAVFCFNRPEKLARSMEALLANPEAAALDVVFFSDGPRNKHDYAGVSATRDYVNNITGFRKVVKMFREKNLSTGPNFQQGLEYMAANFDQVIVVEDDLVVTPNYLAYLLGGLEFYRNESSVFCVTGYAFPIDKGNYPFDTVVHQRFCSYGWATWSDRLHKVRWSSTELNELVHHSPGFKKRLNSEGRDLYRMLRKQLNNKISTWDIQMQVHVAEYNLNVIYPVISKTFNIGFDNQSTNTFGVDYLKTVTDPGQKRNFTFCPVTTKSPIIQRQLRKPYMLPALVTRKLLNTIIKLTNKIRKSPVVTGH